MRRRAGFTLWEMTMVMLIMAITATLSVMAATTRFGTEQPPAAADQMLALLHDARKLAIDAHATTVLRIDPKSLRYQVDTIGLDGTAVYTTGTLDLGMTQTLSTDKPRLEFLFRSSGAAFADTVVVHGGQRKLTVKVDPWSGVARADTL